MQEINSEKCCSAKNPKLFLAILAMILLTIVLSLAIIKDQLFSKDKNKVTITGEGRASMQPDVAVITLGVQVDKVSTSELALKQLNDKINKVIPAIKALGIEEKDIQTQNYSLYPQYDYKDGSTTPAGFNANQQIIIKIRDIQNKPDLAGKVIAEAGKQGINQIDGPSFEVSSLNDLRQKARLEAIKDAKSKAGALAQVAGIKGLGQVVGWTESSQDNSNPMPIYEALGRGGASSDSAKALLPAGSKEIIVQVGLIYEVK